MEPILFITKLNAGGMERVCVTLCNQWVRQDRAVVLYVSYPGGDMVGDLDSRVKVIYASRPARRAVGFIYRLCRSQPNSPLFVLSAELGAVLLVLKRLRLIVNPVVYRESTAALSHCSTFWKWIFARLISRADGIVVQSSGTLEDLEALFRVRQSVAVIRNPCAFVETEPAVPFRIVGSAKGTPVNLLVLGRLEPMKGHIRLLQALNKLKRADWRLSIVGSGGMEQAVREEIRRLGLTTRVEMTGYIKKVRPVYECNDLVVIPSLYEGLPNVLIEALACGCPVLAAKGRGGTVEFMNELGLGDFIIGEHDFESDFPAGVERVQASSRAVWLTAYARMVACVHPYYVANQVWDFMSKVSREVDDKRRHGHAC